MDKVQTTGEWVELKRNRPHGKMTQDCCTGNSAYHPSQFAATKEIKPTRNESAKVINGVKYHPIRWVADGRLVKQAAKHGLDATATQYDNRVVESGRSNVGMRSSLACASSSSKTKRFLAINEETDAALETPKPLSPLSSHAFTVKSKGTRSLRHTIRGMR